MAKNRWVAALAVAGSCAMAAGCGDRQRVETDPYADGRTVAEPYGSEAGPVTAAPSTTVRAPLEEATLAAQMALNRMGMLRTQRADTGVTGIVTAAAPNGELIRVNVTRQTADISTITVSVGDYGQTELAQSILTQIESTLDAGAARAGLQAPGAAPPLTDSATRQPVRAADQPTPDAGAAGAVDGGAAGGGAAGGGMDGGQGANTGGGTTGTPAPRFNQGETNDGAAGGPIFEEGGVRGPDMGVDDDAVTPRR